MAKPTYLSKSHIYRTRPLKEAFEVFMLVLLGTSNAKVIHGQRDSSKALLLVHNYDCDSLEIA